MEIEIKIPSVGESVQEAVLVQWYKKAGDKVQKDEPIFVIETDLASNDRRPRFRRRRSVRLHDYQHTISMTLGTQ